MSIAPNHSNSIMAFLYDICRIDILWHKIDSEDLPTIVFINASSAFALQSQLIRVNCFYNFLCCAFRRSRSSCFFFDFNIYFTFDRVVAYLHVITSGIVLQYNNFSVNYFGQVEVCLNDVHVFWEP